MIRHEGLAPDDRRGVSSEGVSALLQPPTTNPAYGKLWWLNGSAFTARANGGRKPGP